ncbi:MMPL family transporter [Nocardioidaceae bacterium]|nr:MMPL family transporter [Nocardioidaceae bacterium]
MTSTLSRALEPRRAWAVALLGLVLLGAVLGLGQAERDASPTDNLPAGYDSTRVVELQQRYAADEASVAMVLFTAGAADSDASIGPELGGLQQAYASAIGSQVPLQPSEDGTAALGVVPVDGQSATEVAEQVETLRADLRGAAPDGVRVQLTGPAAIQADLAAVFDGADFRLLAATAGIVALLLLVTYRSPILWILPLAVVGLGDQAAAAAATRVMRAVGTPWDESTIGILSVLVFGAGTNYALLLISRYRDELKQHEERAVAMRAAWRRTAEAVLASATTVVVGVLTLVLSVVPATRALGVASAVGIVVAVFAVLVVLPFVLVVPGRWVFWPLVPRVGQTTLVESRSIWSRIGGLVSARPVAVLVVAVLGLGVLAGGLTQVRTGLSESDQFLDTPEAIVAAGRLAASYPDVSSSPTTVLTRDAVAAQSSLAGSDAVRGVESVGPLGGGVEQLDVVLASPPGSQEAREDVRAVRDALADVSGTVVGGSEAEAVDAADAASRDRLLIVPLVLVLVAGALVLLLRSLVTPLLLVTAVVGTYLAALGGAWFVFTGVFGFERLDAGVPLLGFLFLVALGVDYSIFLVTRAAEETPAHGVRRGMIRALGATGGVITSAGILLAAVFAVLGVLPLVVLAQLGTVICLGVLLDALVVRTLVVPALAVALGEKFWWPRTFADIGDARPTA